MATVAITPDQDTVIGEIFIAAPPARVFQAITDPEQMPCWWGAHDTYTSKDWKADVRVGGKWSNQRLRRSSKHPPMKARTSTVTPIAIPAQNSGLS